VGSIIAKSKHFDEPASIDAEKITFTVLRNILKIDKVDFSLAMCCIHVGLYPNFSESELNIFFKSLS